ncbi:MAG: tyrosine-type recombinase/integrase, partial [Rubrivivax sp.]|nr:tyrosine-type recombinase/integrase [Rubrivivax sp.]
MGHDDAGGVNSQLPAFQRAFDQHAPPIVARTSATASERFLEFFAATIENANTRAAYVRAVADFLAWPSIAALTSLNDIRPLHVAAYIEDCKGRFSAPTVKQRLAALRSCFDWMTSTGVMASNPAHSVRGPAHKQEKGKTPILTPEEAGRLLEGIRVQQDDGSPDILGLRDRALIAMMTYSFARVSAAVGMNVEDVVQTAGRSWIRLKEKGGHVHEMPAHHKLLDYLDAYLDAAGHRSDPKAPLFRTGPRGAPQLTMERMSRKDAYAMVRRRATGAGIKAKIGNHSFR